MEGRNALIGSHYGAAYIRHHNGEAGSLVRVILGILSFEVVTDLKENVILSKQQLIGVSYLLRQGIKL